MKKEHQKAVTKAELKAILASWPADFSNRLLVGVNISHNRSLECSDFRGAVLRDCTFSHCKFDNSDFTGADLGDSVFERCKMEYCSFDGAQMDDAIFDRCACFGSTGMNGDIRTQSEVVFDGMMGMIRGVVMANASDWRQFYWDLCEPDDENYAQRLWEAQERFHEIDRAYPGMGAEIFNSGFHFLPEELVNAAGFIAQGGSVEGVHQLPAAEWISSGGSAEEALTMARNGEFMSANIDEALNGPTMEM